MEWARGSIKRNENGVVQKKTGIGVANWHKSVGEYPLFDNKENTPLNFGWLAQWLIKRIKGSAMLLIKFLKRLKQLQYKTEKLIGLMKESVF